MTITAPDVSEVAAVKGAAGLRVSVCGPARNEAPTVAGVVSPLVTALDGPGPLLD